MHKTARGQEHASRTGPIGRLARLAWAIAAAITAASLIDDRGTARFRNPHVLSEPAAWFLHGLALVVFVILVRGIASVGSQSIARRAQWVALGLLAALGVSLGALGQALHQSVWGFPLADGVWIFDVVMLGQEAVAFVIAIILGTPGCEIGVWPELVARLRHEPIMERTGLACIVGLQFVDHWEAARLGRPR